MEDVEVYISCSIFFLDWLMIYTRKCCLFDNDLYLPSACHTLASVNQSLLACKDVLK